MILSQSCRYVLEGQLAGTDGTQPYRGVPLSRCPAQQVLLFASFWLLDRPYTPPPLKVLPSRLSPG